MFITSSGIQGDTSKHAVVRTPDWQAFWCGLVYLEGTPAGEESVLRFLRTNVRNLSSTSALLKGAYFIVLVDQQSGMRYAFIDPNGLYHAFYTSSGAGTSFLELAAAAGFGVDDIRPESLIEFFHGGYLSFGETFFPAIRRLDPVQLLRITEGMVEPMPRRLRDFDTPPLRSLEECLAAFASSVGHETISLDLTGGIDSRLLAVTLQHLGLHFEVALSGTPGNQDIAIAQRVANALGCEFHVTRHDVEEWEASLPRLFVACDGMFDVLRAHRPYQLHKERRARGISLALSGAGGELFKDFWWLQDFPWYRRRAPNLRRLFETRIAPVEPRHDHLAEPYRSISRRYAAAFCDRLAEYVVEGNTRTYDRIYYEWKMRDYAGRFLTNHSNLLPCYAPYLDREVATIGYHLPRHIRVFNRFHRRTITRYDPAVASIPTTEGGVSVSSSAGRMVADIPKYLYDKATRLERKLSQKILHSSRPLESPNNPELWVQARALLHSRNTLERFKDHGFLSSTLLLNDLSPEYVGSILSLDLLFERLEAAQYAAPRTQAVHEHVG